MAGKFALKKTTHGKFQFNLLAGNGQVILSSEVYEAKASATAGIESVRKNAPDDGRYERLSAKDGSPYFTLKAANGQVIGQSQMYASTASRDTGIESVKTNAPGAVIDDQTA
ncbi:YegP family protein [Xenophilus sp. Marseille-Q4582]|uniref:YegP family protein n=1 Tax=Xenophilus sp. Marseille-Q4582 TaxID=2866600 RepID=UPI001CE3EB42|nr:YegP family protein [Xenophilus sp. Marseille-Q4582]